mgnify:CR=1 FL=1
MNEKELLCRMALPLLPGIGLVGARHLIQAAGSATMLFEHARELPALLPGVTPKVATAFPKTMNPTLLASANVPMPRSCYSTKARPT